MSDVAEVMGMPLVKYDVVNLIELRQQLHAWLGNEGVYVYQCLVGVHVHVFISLSLSLSLSPHLHSWVQDFLSDANHGLKELVQYMSMRYQNEARYICHNIVLIHAARNTCVYTGW